MEITWLAPSAVLAVGAVIVAVIARRIAEAAEGVERARRRSGRLEDSLIPVRVETRRARSSIDRLGRR